MLVVFNPSRGPVTYDSDGRVIGAQSWGRVDHTDPTTAHLIKVGILVVTDPGADSE